MKKLNGQWKVRLPERPPKSLKIIPQVASLIVGSDAFVALGYTYGPKARLPRFPLFLPPTAIFCPFPSFFPQFPLPLQP
jgi:hypothetical protein